MSSRLIALFLAVPLMTACGNKNQDDTSTVDTDTDTDADTDSDTDADADADTDTDADTDADTDSDIPDDAMDGKIMLMDDKGEGQVLAAKAFTWSSGSTSLVYVTPNTDATCDLVADYLGRPDDEGHPQVIDPSDLFLTDHCNLTFLSSSSLPLTVDLEEDSTSLIVSVMCTLDDGSFEYTTVGDQTGYYWSGLVYSGYGYQGQLTVSEGTDGVEVEGDVDSVNSSYPYEEYADTKARSTVSGKVYGVTCEALSETPTFSN